MPDGQSARRERTEQLIVEAATSLFQRNGYARTSLTAVAKAAGVAPRTVYLRFETKAKLFQRVIETGVVGDSADTPLRQRPWSVQAMAAPNLQERIVAFADGVSDMHERLGPLMAVNGEAESSEPIIHESASAARAETLNFLRTFWESADRDGLLPSDADLEWLIDTTTILSAAETRLLITRTLDWSRESFRNWLIASWQRLVVASTVASR